MLFANTRTNIFTNEEVSLGTIHIVRDPRNVISLYFIIFQKKIIMKQKNFLFDKNKALGKKFDLKDPNVNRNIFG